MTLAMIGPSSPTKERTDSQLQISYNLTQTSNPRRGFSRRTLDASTVLETGKRLTNDIERIKTKISTLNSLISNEDQIKQTLRDLDSEIKDLKATIRKRQTELKLTSRDLEKQSSKSGPKSQLQTLQEEKHFYEEKVRRKNDELSQKETALQIAHNRAEKQDSELAQIKSQHDSFFKTVTSLGPNEAAIVDLVLGKTKQDDVQSDASNDETNIQRQKLLEAITSNTKQISSAQQQSHAIQNELRQWQDLASKKAQMELAKARDIRNMTLQLEGMKQTTPSVRPLPHPKKASSKRPLQQSPYNRPMYSSVPNANPSFVMDPNPTPPSRTQLQSLGPQSNRHSPPSPILSVCSENHSANRTDNESISGSSFMKGFPSPKIIPDEGTGDGISVVSGKF
ncbi:hypothetical protein BLNAU_1670 [Blattamonas nauphoetae]|uniref:Uncharacterized protein n=1 Tax=Blattamonas nauphoetae TaxID=2049346 RepID=A0ABQ9YHA6_9EUKA|nr:hypothetical protein BLNAU_1670 [Blattamonas nauphoetae]